MMLRDFIDSVKAFYARFAGDPFKKILEKQTQKVFTEFIPKFSRTLE